MCSDPGPLVVVQDRGGELWQLAVSMLDFGRVVQVGSRDLPEWDRAAIAHLEMEILHYLDKIRRGDQEQDAAVRGWRMVAESINWQLQRNGGRFVDLPWKREAAPNGNSYQCGRLRDVRPDVWQPLVNGPAKKAASGMR